MTKLEALKLDYAIQRRILRMNEQIDIALLKDKDAMLSPKEQELIQKFDAATTAIGNRISVLVEATKQDLSPEAVAAFQAEIDKLTALGADPANPVPSPEPPVPIVP